MPPQPVSPQTWPLPASVAVREVGPRDGLQNERPIAPSERARLAVALVAAGVRSIEAVSFVSERAVPAMAGAAEVLAAVAEALDRAGTRREVTLVALVPNLRGAEAAFATEVDELTVTISASPAYNEKNVRMTVAESLGAIGAIAARADRRGVPVDAVVSCAFGSPFGEEIEPRSVAELAAALKEAGCTALTLADTTGAASPRSLDEVLAAVEHGAGTPPQAVGLHLHDTRGTALVNAWAAMERGVARFDTSVGGLGGSPFLPGAGGNLASEDLVALLTDVGVATGVDLERLLTAATLAEELVGHALPSRTMSALRVAPAPY